MIKLNYAHLCEYAFIKDNGTPGIIGIFSRIKSKLKSITLNNIALVLNIIPGDTNKHKLNIIIKSPSKKTSFKFEDDIGLIDKKTQSLGTIINIQNLKLNEEGKYNVEIMINKKKIESLPLLFEIEKK